MRRQDNKDVEENLLIDEEFKHTRKMSYRWLVSNAVFQATCLLLIALIVFLVDLVDLHYDNPSEDNV